MKSLKAVLLACAAQVLLASPAWAHPSVRPHLHADQLFPVLTLTAALWVAVALRRSRTRLE
ncbi:MAG TPA: hypothetical protein VL241_00345 [Gemmatimonadales bacterium]|nr:hypothetical protein [Gemmatimonadales bacterium]